jgi:hypothetical protein
MKYRIIQVLFLIFAVQGCISFEMGPERTFPEAKAKNQLSVQSVTQVIPKIEKWPADEWYVLSLMAEGQFVNHKGYFMKRGMPCLAVGFWPGCVDRESSDMAVVLLGSVLLNFSTCGVPTLWTLFCEPFCDYHERNSARFELADIGLIGFNKYYRGSRNGSFVSESTQNLSSYALYGYVVTIDGERYEDKDYGEGYSGKIYFKSSRPRGSQIVIRIVKPPSERSDSKEGLADLKGLEILGILP